MPAPLRVAALAFTATGDAAANARRITQAIDDAAGARAQVVLTPECALTGYPSVVHAELSGVDWCAIAEHEDTLLRHAERRDVLLVLGSAGPVPGGIANLALVGGAIAPARYAKRHLTPTDRHHFVAGHSPLVLEYAGWRLGLAICYDVRFAPVFHDLAAADADAFLVIAHMAGPDPDPGTKSTVIPHLLAARAVEWATPLVFANTAAADRYCDSALIDARGVSEKALGEGLLLGELKHRDTLAPWYSDLRREHLATWG